MPEKKNHPYHELDMMVTGYGKRGLCTLLYWSDGTEEAVDLKPDTVLKRIAELYGKTPQSVRRQWRIVQKATAERPFGKMAVLPISPGIILMPVKLARKMVGRDSAIGYVNLAQPLQFLEDKDGNGARSRIFFRRSEHVLDTVWTCRTLRKHCVAARMFWLETEQRHARERSLTERAQVYLNWYAN